MHRHREYGPFDYEWSRDFCGIELMCCGRKFGEYCSHEEIFADLKPFGLPMRVVEVACVVMGSLVYGLLSGLSAPEKHADLVTRLQNHGLARFAERIERSDAA